jgi:sec-independent protein translocase protein TatB
MPSLGDNIFIFILALLLFGPKRLPKLAREVGKWVGEFRRASADFRLQMDDELRISDQAEKQKQIDAMQAASPVAVPAEVIPDPVHPHIPVETADEDAGTAGSSSFMPVTTAATVANHDSFPIATSGELTLMPPSTGLPAEHKPVTPATDMPAASSDAFGSLIDSIPAAAAAETEHATHG